MSTNSCLPVLAEAPHEFMFFWHMRAWTDFLQMTGTFFLTLLFSIEVGVASDSFLLAQGGTLRPRHAATPQSRKAAKPTECCVTTHRR